MSFAPSALRHDRRPNEQEGVAKACNAIKNWLASNPPTPTRPSSHPTKDGTVKQASSPSHQNHSLTQSKGPGGVSLIATECKAFASGTSLPDAEPTVNSPRCEPQEKPSHEPTQATTGYFLSSEHSRSSWSISDLPSNIDGHENENQNFGLISEEIATSDIERWLPSLRAFEPPLLTFPSDSPDIVAAYKHDIDPCTGLLVEEVQHPETLQDRHLGPSRDQRDIAWRQANMTAELQIIREIASREKLATKLRSQLKPEQESAPPVEETPWPNADCKLRPAMPEDFEQISKIINLEGKATNCPQVLESKEVTASDVKKMYDSCRDNMRPFIVATASEDELFDRSKWPKNADKAYREWLKFKRSQKVAPAEIFGFALVTDARIGLLDAPCPGSRFTGQVRIIVDPSHRRKLYGSALLDRILLSVAPYHRSLVDYGWHCQNPELVYETLPGYNRRQYTWLYIEAFCAAKDDADVKWRDEFLGKFEFKQVAYLPQAVKTDRFYDSQWLDCALWALEAQPRANIVDHAPEA